MISLKELSQLVAKYTGKTDDKDLREYEMFLKGDSLPEKTRKRISTEFSGIVKKLSGKNPKIAGTLNDVLNKAETCSGLPELNLFFSKPEMQDYAVASMGDIYRFADTLKLWFDEGDYKKVLEADSVLENFKKTFCDHDKRIITSTKLIYHTARNIVDIIDYFDANKPRQAVRSVATPYFGQGAVVLTKNIDRKNLPDFLPALLNTRDPINVIMDKLKLLFGPKKNERSIETSLSVEIPCPVKYPFFDANASLYFYNPASSNKIVYIDCNKKNPKDCLTFYVNKSKA